MTVSEPSAQVTTIVPAAWSKPRVSAAPSPSQSKPSWGGSTQSSGAATGGVNRAPSSVVRGPEASASTEQVGAAAVTAVPSSPPQAGEAEREQRGAPWPSPLSAASLQATTTITG